MLDSANIYLIQKGNKLEKQRPKMPYGHGVGQVSQETETRKEFQGKEGHASDELRHPDHMIFDKKVKLGGHSTTKRHYKGHNEKFAEKQNERFDNLKPATEIRAQKLGHTQTHHGGKTPDRKADQELFGHNYTKGKSGHKFLENPEQKKGTAYQKQFNETLKVDTIHDKPHYGKDDKTKDFLYQYHKGYYHTDE